MGHRHRPVLRPPTRPGEGLNLCKASDVLEYANERGFRGAALVVVDSFRAARPSVREGSRDLAACPTGGALLVTTDRLSAFDRIIGLVPNKGQVLNQLAAWWFEQTARHRGQSRHLGARTRTRSSPSTPRRCRSRWSSGLGSPVDLHRHPAPVPGGERVLYGHRAARRADSPRAAAPSRSSLQPPRQSTAVTTNRSRSPRSSIGGLVDAELWARIERGGARPVRPWCGDGRRSPGSSSPTPSTSSDSDGRRCSCCSSTRCTPPTRPGTGPRPTLERAPGGRAGARRLRQGSRCAWPCKAAGYTGDGPPPELPTEVWDQTSARYVELYERLTGIPFVPGVRTCPTNRLIANLAELVSTVRSPSRPDRRAELRSRCDIAEGRVRGDRSSRARATTPPVRRSSVSTRSSTVARKRPASPSPTVGPCGSTRAQGLVNQVFDPTCSPRWSAAWPSATPATRRPVPTPSATSSPTWSRPCTVRSGVAHNGNLVNTDQLRQQLLERGAGLQSSSDSEVIGPHAGRRRGRQLGGAPRQRHATWEGAYSLVHHRRHQGHRLSAIHGASGHCRWASCPSGGHAVASETGALRTLGCENIREIEPGEVVVLQGELARSIQAVPPAGDAGPLHLRTHLLLAARCHLGRHDRSTRPASGSARNWPESTRSRPMSSSRFPTRRRRRPSATPRPRASPTTRGSSRTATSVAPSSNRPTSSADRASP